MNRAADLALYASTALPLALQATGSDIDDFYSSASFAAFRKQQEGKGKLVNIFLGRFDNLSRQLSGLGNLIAKRGF